MLLALDLQAFFTHDLTLVRVTGLRQHLKHQRTHDAPGDKITLDRKGVKRVHPPVANNRERAVLGLHESGLHTATLRVLNGGPDDAGVRNVVQINEAVRVDDHPIRQAASVVAGLKVRLNLQDRQLGAGRIDVGRNEVSETTSRADLGGRAVVVLAVQKGLLPGLRVLVGPEVQVVSPLVGDTVPGHHAGGAAHLNGSRAKDLGAVRGLGGVVGTEVLRRRTFGKSRTKADNDGSRRVVGGRTGEGTGDQQGVGGGAVARDAQGLVSASLADGEHIARAEFDLIASGHGDERVTGRDSTVEGRAGGEVTLVQPVELNLINRSRRQNRHSVRGHAGQKRKLLRRVHVDGLIDVDDESVSKVVG